ncbi:prepilin-type N-terminal cleavage/methylation domain-containing protein [Candidatus Saccharibacteria bacterium]|nr:prepilin-type N-terminal cleavage/methylation domain-containing protein [Candidatus Saccharibacteria bacterium]
MKNTNNHKTACVNKKFIQHLGPSRSITVVSSIWRTCLSKAQASQGKKKTWFQSWILSMQRRIHKKARHFGLDAVQESKGVKRASRMGEYGERVTDAADTAMRQEGWQNLGFAQNRPARPKSSGGFTIVELLIATAVFSLVLMTALAGFLQIGRLFYQGVSSTQTQSVVNQLFQDIVGNFQTAANISSPQNAGGYSYYCIGNSRYTYNIGKKVNLADTPKHAPLAAGGNFGLLKDVLPGATACATPCDDLAGGACPAGAVAFNQPIEILGNNMRLESFNLQQNLSVSPNFYNVSVVVAYGDDELLDFTVANDPSTVFCKGGSSNQQFCAVSRLATGVYRGQGP